MSGAPAIVHYRLECGVEIAGLHPDAVLEARMCLEAYGGVASADQMARALATYEGWKARQAAQERLHEKRRDREVTGAEQAEQAEQDALAGAADAEAAAEAEGYARYEAERD